MSEKKAASKWSNPELLQRLMLALYGQLKANLNKEAKDAIEEKMHRDGFEDVTWEAIRTKPLLHLTTNTMSRVTMKWTPEVDQQVLVAMVKTMTPNAEQYSAIIQDLHAHGHQNFTISALKCAFLFIAATSLLSLFQLSPHRHGNANLYDRQHIQKLQRKEQTPGDGGEASTTPVKKAAKKAPTPRKRKTPVKKAKTESDAEDEEEQEQTPPPKKPRTPKKPSMKEEADEFLNTDAMEGNRFEPNDVEI
ncbi:hypothetical protein LX36DRAFT_670271 [Colletotrichum falcatum]|nr:hypothetical protein LX36DRAFT_670271 [Colletotrichum falcatum]